MSDIASQMHPFPITVSSYFTFYVICIFRTSGLFIYIIYGITMNCVVLYVWFDWRDILYFHSLILLNTLTCKFPLLFCFGWQSCIHVNFILATYSATTRLVVLVCSCIFKSNKCFFFLVEILSFSFCLVNSECDAYLPVDQSLLYSRSKMFLLFFNLIFFDSYLGFFVFCSWI